MREALCADADDFDTNPDFTPSANPCFSDIIAARLSRRHAADVGGTNGTDAANPRYYNDPKGATAQKGNPNGHVIRFADTGGNPAAVTFKWDVYLFGARSTASADINVSNLGADNDFSSPDGMWFSQAAPGTDGLRRFLVGPVDCEITGIAESGDGRALFVNIQHPGENSKTIGDPGTFLSHWRTAPGAAPGRPRW